MAGLASRQPGIEPFAQVGRRRHAGELLGLDQQAFGAWSMVGNHGIAVRGDGDACHFPM